MTSLNLLPPPGAPDREWTRTLLLDQLIFRTRTAAAAFVVVLFVAGWIWRLVTIGPWWLSLAIAIAVAGTGYILIGGALCGAFLRIIRRWPRPLPPVRIEGPAFVRTWPLAAHKVLSVLAQPAP